MNSFDRAHGFPHTYGVIHYKTDIWKDHPFLICEVPRQAETGLVLWDSGWYIISTHGSLEEVELVLAVKFQKKLGEKFWDSRDITNWKAEDL